MIKINNVKKNYKNCIALQDISLTIDKNEIFGLLGPNGAGKTTLIKILTGIIEDYEGDVFYDNNLLKDIVHTADFKKNVGIVPQDNIFFDKLTARENIETFCQFQDIKKSERKNIADKLLKSVNLLDKEEMIVSTYSGGMKKRLNIALALITFPKILFMDEPTVGLDPEVRQEIWLLIQELNEEGISIIITTHYMEEAESLCSRIAVLKTGKIAINGTMEELRIQTNLNEEASLENVYLEALKKEV